MSTSPKKVLVLSSADTEQNRMLNDKFVAAINQQFGDNMQLQWAHYTDIGFYYNDGKIEAFWVIDGQLLPQFDLAYFKSYYRFSENALALVEHFKQAGTRFVCSELDVSISFSKLSQYARLTRAGLPIPETLYIPRVRMSDQFDVCAKRLDVPFIMKGTDAKGGAANFLIHDQTEYRSALDQYPDQEFVSQAFIPNDSDLRMLVLNHKVELIIKRQRQDNSTHLNNTSRGAQAVLVDPSEFSPQTLELAIKAAALLQREIGGVDLMLASGSGQPYILEVNASPQVASGAFPAEKIENYGIFLNNMLL